MTNEMKHIELEQTDKVQHICINDTLDIVVIQTEDSYNVKVLNNKFGKLITAELIDFNEYQQLMGEEEYEDIFVN